MTFVLAHEFWSGLNVWLPVIRVTSNPLAKAYRKCASTMVPVIGCISRDAATKSSFCWSVAIKAHRMLILKPLKNLPVICRITQ